MQEGEINARFRERLRKPPSPYAVTESLPVLFFGDIFSAELATIGLNPSDREYLDPRGELLSGPRQRFATLCSLGAPNRASLTDRDCDEAVRRMRDYFDPGKPVYGWFAGLERVAGGLHASLHEGSATHLDLVQEATRPTWSSLPTAERNRLLEADLEFLDWQVRRFPIRAIICNGKTVSVHVRQSLGATVEETGHLARIEWWAGSATVNGRRVHVAGWNYPLARPTGLGAGGERRLGELLGEKLGPEP